MNHPPLSKKVLHLITQQVFNKFNSQRFLFIMVGFKIKPWTVIN